MVRFAWRRVRLIGSIGLLGIALVAVEAPSAQAPLRAPDKQPVEAASQPLAADVDLPFDAPRTFSSGPLSLAIPDHSTLTSTIDAVGPGIVTDVNVRVRVSHPFDSDLALILIAPNGAAVTLSSTLGGSSDDYGTGPGCSGTLAGFDDEATTPVVLTAAPFAGTFRPMRPLSTLDGSYLQGTWRLQVLDRFAGDTGTLLCWELTVRRLGAPKRAFDWVLPNVTVWRPSTASWFSSTSPYTASTVALVLGQSGDIPVNALYTNAFGAGDPALFRPTTGQWFIAQGPPFVFGVNGDIPVPADYTGDGLADVAVFRPSLGIWFFRNLGMVQWGVNGDIPVTEDYNADGFSDIAVWRPSTATWYVAGEPAVIWGAPGDIPVPGNYFGDDRAEYAVFRPSNGTWYILAADGEVRIIQYGTTGDIPVPADYADDGHFEIAVWRPSDGRWYIRDHPTIAFGATGDIPTSKRPTYPGYPY